MKTETETLTPVKGMVWLHARRTEYDGAPQVLTVTSVNQNKGLVYSTTSYHTKVKTPLALFSLEKMVREVVSTPEVKAKDPSVKLAVAECFMLHTAAHAAGMAAGEAAQPTPMVVVEHANPFDDNSSVVTRYAPIMDGPCGFAYVSCNPGNSSFARYMKSHLGGYHGYYGGTEMGVSPFGQSLTRKVAYARAYVEVLRSAGVNASYNSRMD